MERGPSFDPLEAWPFNDESRSFVSGSNHAGEIRGVADCGCNIGITVREINKNAEKLLGLKDRVVTKVFADSGACGEITFASGARAVKKLITHADWMGRLGPTNASLGTTRSWRARRGFCWSLSASTTGRAGQFSKSCLRPANAQIADWLPRELVQRRPSCCSPAHSLSQLAPRVLLLALWMGRAADKAGRPILDDPGYVVTADGNTLRAEMQATWAAWQD